ncbi:MAG TPA: site-2 protease family protein [Streptosporangiaceae bacterium]|nr:site-2 protease family protein [Streptosporangiaceae bacterium]
MGAHRWLRLGDGLSTLLPYLAGLLAIYVLSPFPRHLGGWAGVALIAGLGAAILLSTVVHELGHVLAIRLAGIWPTAIHLLGPPDRVTFHVGAMQVGLGIKPGGGEVEYPGRGLSAAQSAVIAAAGPAAELVIAPLVLLLPIARWAAVYLAVIMAADGLSNLIPAKTEDGSLSDGVTLIRARARSRADADIRELLAAPDWSHRPDAGQRLINGWVLDVPAAEDCLKRLPDDRDALLRVYAQPWLLPERPETESLNVVHALSWKVVAKPDVSARLADLAASRVEWVLGHVDKRDDPEARPRPRDVRHTLSVVRLRQGQPADVRRLCADALAADMDPDDRATVLATVAMAKHQLYLLASARQALDEALALDPSADLVPEAVSVLGNGAPSFAATPPASIAGS